MDPASHAEKQNKAWRNRATLAMRPHRGTAKLREQRRHQKNRGAAGSTGPAARNNHIPRMALWREPETEFLSASSPPRHPASQLRLHARVLAERQKIA